MGNTTTLGKLSARLKKYKEVFSHMGVLLNEGVPDQLRDRAFTEDIYAGISNIRNAFAQVTKINDVQIKPFKGGKLVVTHRTAGVDLTVKVYMDAADIAQKVVETKRIKKGPKKNEKVATKR